MIEQYKGQLFKFERVELFTRRDCEVIYSTQTENKFCLVHEDYYCYYLYYFEDQKLISDNLFDIYEYEEEEVSDCECSSCSGKCNKQNFLTHICWRTRYFFYCPIIGTIYQVVIETKEEKAFNFEKNVLIGITDSEKTDYLLLFWRNFRCNPQEVSMEIRNIDTLDLLMKFENILACPILYPDLMNQRLLTISFEGFGNIFQLRPNKLHQIATVFGVQYKIKDKLLIERTEKHYKFFYLNSRIRQFRTLCIENKIPNTSITLKYKNNHILWQLTGKTFVKAAVYQWWKGQLKEDNILIKELYRDALEVKLRYYKIYILKLIPLETGSQSIDEIEGYESESMD